MNPDNEERRPQDGGTGAQNTSDGVAAEGQGSTVVANATCCPLACSPSCSFRCPLPVASLAIAYGRALFRVRAA